MQNETNGEQKSDLITRFGEQKQWVLWKLETVEDGKTTKRPYQRNGTLASSTDPATWCTYEEARAVAHHFTGIGFVFPLDMTVVGIDFDHCLKDGEIVYEPFKTVFNSLNTFSEVSPSGDGLHSFVVMTEPMQLEAHSHKFEGAYKIEVYASKRFFTVTEQPYGNAPLMRTVTPAELTALLSGAGYPWKSNPTQLPTTTQTQSISIDDADLFEKMFSAKNGPQVRALYDGDVSGYGDDDSSADLALCSHLAFWTQKNAVQMERIWVASPLGKREKTQERDDYRTRTIQKAIEGAGEVYRPVRNSSVVSGNEQDTRSENKDNPNLTRVEFKRLGDLLNEPEEHITWIVENMLPSSGFSMIVAKPKVGKSTLVRQMALAVARGEPFLDHTTTKGLVMYVALEEKRSEVIKHFKQLGATDEEVLIYVGSAPQEAQKWLQREIQARKPILVIIDTLFRFVNIKNGNDYAEVTTALSPILALARENGAHVMVVHHAGKSDREGGDATLGSTAILASVDTSIVLKKKDGKRTIETIQRYGTDMEATVLVYDEETRKTSLGLSKESDDLQRIEDEITTFLFDHSELCVEKTIEAQIEGRTHLKRKALRSLVTKGTVQRLGTGKKNDPYQYACSLVPTIYTEQAKQVLGMEEVPLSVYTDACSQESDSKGRNSATMKEPTDSVMDQSCTAL